MLKIDVNKINKFNFYITIVAIFLLGFIFGTATLPFWIYIVGYFSFIIIGYYFLFYKVIMIIKDKRSRENVQDKEKKALCS